MGILPNLNPFKKKKGNEPPREGQPIAKVDVYASDQELEISVKGEKGIKVKSGDGGFREPPSRGVETIMPSDWGTPEKIRAVLLDPNEKQIEAWSIITRQHQSPLSASLTFDEVIQEGDKRRGERYESVTKKYVRHFLTLSRAVQGNESGMIKAALKLHEDMTEQTQSGYQGRVNR